MPGWNERGLNEVIISDIFFYVLLSDRKQRYQLGYCLSWYSVHLFLYVHSGYLTVFVFFKLFAISSDDQFLTPSLILKANCVQCANRQHYIYTRMKPAGFHPPTHPLTNTNTQELEQQELSWALLMRVCDSVILSSKCKHVLPSTVCWAHEVSGNIQHLTKNVRSNRFNSLFAVYKTLTHYSRVSLLWNENIKKNIYQTV